MDAADALLLELGQLDAREKSLAAECDQEVAALKQRLKQKLVIKIGNAEVSFAERRKAILKGLEAFADQNRDELLDGDAKSVTLNHGTLGWRKSPPSLSPAVKKGGAKGNEDILEQVRGWIAERIEKFKLFAAGTGKFLRIKAEWDKESLKDAVLKNEIDRNELRRAGFLLDEGSDAFFAEPSGQGLQSV